MKIHGKTTRNALLALLVASGAGAAFAQTSLSAEIHSGPGGTTVDVGYFYDDLASSGNWVQSPSYGWVWSPRSVASDWRPYRDGNWVWSDQGWTWVSNESYGWATYHYGRWYDDPEFGWAWVPGNDWAPAWVSWQEGGDYIGWAPLPPSVNIAVGFSGALSVSLAPDAYLFVPERQFLAPRLSGYYLSRDQVPVIYRQTRNITNYRYTDNRVYNTGVAVDRIQRVVGRPVPRYQIADLNATSGRRVQIQGNRLAIFRPRVQRSANVPPPPARPIARRAVVTPTQLQASRPNRPGRPAAAQNGAHPGAQNQQPPAAAQNAPRNPRNRQGNQPTPATPATPQERNNPLPTHRTPPVQTTPSQPAPPAQRTPRHQVQPNPDQPRPEAPPPQQPKRRTPPPPAQQDRQRVQPPQQEKQRTPPPPQQDRQRVQPPPQQERPNRQAPPPEQRQRPAAPAKQQNPKQQPPPRDRENKPQQDEHKPPVR
jgi:hypothetical protein